MFTQLKIALVAGVGIVVTILVGAVGFLKLKVARKDAQIADTKLKQSEASEQLLRRAQNGIQTAGEKSDEKALEERAKASRGDRSHFE